MGIFADVGRSTAFQTGQGVFRDALAVGQQERQGLMDAVTLKHQEDQMAMAQKKEARDEEEYKRKTRPILLSDLVGKGTENGRPETMKVFSDAAKMSGAAKITLPDGTEDWTISAADLPVVQKYMEMQKDLHPQVLMAKYKDNRALIAQREKDILKAKTPQEADAMKAEIEGMKQDNGDILLEFNKGKDVKPNVFKPGDFVQQDDGSLVQMPDKQKDQWVDENRNVGGKPVEGQRNTATNEWKARAQGSNVTVNMPTQGETQSIVAMIHDNGLDPTQIPKRGGVWNKAMAEWKREYPQENINDYAAFAKWKRDTGVNKSMTLLDSIEPMLVKMEKLHKDLGLSNFTDVNKMKVWMKQHTGDPRVAEYETYMRNVVQELPPAMTGYFPTDTRIQMELKNLETAKAPAQIGASISAVRDLVRVRRQQFFAPSWSPLMKNQSKPEVKRLTYNPTTGELE